MTAAQWSDDRVELLRKLWAEGLSASQIAGQLGGGVSRNAVIGKVHRLQLSGRGRTPNQPPRAKKAAVPAVKPPVRAPQPVARPVTPSIGATALQAQFGAEAAVREAPRPAPDRLVLPASRNLQLIQLNERTCKWPIGDPLADDFHFCGNEAGDAGPYCRYHARIAFQPASERRRLR